MQVYLEFLATLPVMVVCYQFYTFATNCAGKELQSRCRNLGIIFMTIGITALISREIPFVFMGLLLIMMGFRLTAKGLDRIGKHVFIDRYSGNDNGSEPNLKDKGDANGNC